MPLGLKLEQCHIKQLKTVGCDFIKISLVAYLMIDMKYSLYHIQSLTSLLQGGNWTFDEGDDTWKKLMTTPMKWKVLKVEYGSDLFYLFEILAARNEDFAKFVFPKLSPGMNEFDSLGESPSAVKELNNAESGELLVKKEEVMC